MPPKKKTKRVTVLLDEKIASDLDEYCRETARKKSTLVASLIEEFLRKENFPEEPRLL